jgi:hypothetical protein
MYTSCQVKRSIGYKFVFDSIIDRRKINEMFCVTHAIQHTCYTLQLSIHIASVRINKFSSCASSLKPTETSSTKCSLVTSREVSVAVQEVANFALAPWLRPMKQVHRPVECRGVVCWDKASELLHKLDLRKEQANRTEQPNNMATTELSQHE